MQIKVFIVQYQTLVLLDNVSNQIVIKKMRDWKRWQCNHYKKLWKIEAMFCAIFIFKKVKVYKVLNSQSLRKEEVKRGAIYKNNFFISSKNDYCYS